MPASVFDLFSIGVGPSSSHTLGPLRAARDFVRQLRLHHVIDITARVSVDLFGSLALTGRGHCTDKAILIGLAGRQPEDIAPGELAAHAHAVDQSRSLLLDGLRALPFHPDRDLSFHGAHRLPAHSNGLRFHAWDASGHPLREAVYYSVGGGFVVDAQGKPIGEEGTDSDFSFPYTTAEALLLACQSRGLRIADLIWDWERNLRNDQQIRDGML
ncbi:MAG: hypothetical protein MUF01_18705, partial [Bryobacterales bacterium]|nr:hypothetical protein [Bryobacterales bacterium]